MKTCKITVMRMTSYPDLSEQYENPMEHVCDMALGQVFVSREAQMPEGFCYSAWDSVGPYVTRLAKGEENFFDGWMKDPKSAMISCNDGFRPVSFYIEVVEE